MSKLTRKEKDQILKLLREAVDFCLPLDNCIHIKIEKVAFLPGQRRLIKKFINTYQGELWRR